MRAGPRAQALFSDLHKSEFEGYCTELQLVEQARPPRRATPPAHRAAPMDPARRKPKRTSTTWTSGCSRIACRRTCSTSPAARTSTRTRSAVRGRRRQPAPRLATHARACVPAWACDCSCLGDGTLELPRTAAAGAACGRAVGGQLRCVAPWKLHQAHIVRAAAARPCCAVCVCNLSVHPAMRSPCWWTSTWTATLSGAWPALCALVAPRTRAPRAEWLSATAR
jgi:hypothetical protein